MGKKIPDLVVFDEEKGYYQRELTYGTNHGAPAIKLEDVGGWKQMQAGVANKQFKSRYDELKEEFQKLIDEVNWNELVINRFTRLYLLWVKYITYMLEKMIVHSYH